MRLIDADELLRKLEEYFNKKEQDAKFTGNRGSEVSWNDAIYYIRTAPPAQPEQRWIPVSETEPKKSGHYLCTHVVSNSFGGIKIVCPDYYTTQEEAEELFADPEDEYLDLEEYIGWTSKNVIAWMPMPEPYQEEGE